jgi:hypothetical protein
MGRKTGQALAIWQQYVYRMIQRRAVAAGIKTKIGNHTFRATGITAYLKNKGYAGARPDARQPFLASHARKKSRSTRWRRLGFDRQRQ